MPRDLGATSPPDGGAEAGPTTGRRRQRVAAILPPRFREFHETSDQNHCHAAGGCDADAPTCRRAIRAALRVEFGRRSLGRYIIVCETYFLKNCSTNWTIIVSIREGRGNATKNGSKIRFEQYQQISRTNYNYHL